MIKGYEDGPPTLCQPASQQGGGEEVNNLLGGAWRGLEECWGLWQNFWVSLLFSYKKSVFNHLRGRDWRACLYQFLAELNERRYLDESESFVV